MSEAMGRFAAFLFCRSGASASRADNGDPDTGCRPRYCNPPKQWLHCRLKSEAPSPSVRHSGSVWGAPATKPILDLLRVRVPFVVLLCFASAPLWALIGGQPDSTALYPSVVSLRIDSTHRCTATKIGERSYLTAAHCVIDIPAGTLAAPFQSGGNIAVSNSPEPRVDSDYRALRVESTWLPDAFKNAFDRLHAYQTARIADFRSRYSGDDLTGRIARVYAESNIAPRFPDVAIVVVADATPTIPASAVDLRPLTRETDVVLVGYGCERTADLANRAKPVRRTWGRSQVIRADQVNFYTYAADLRPNAPSTCPGDSGGPVLKDGVVAGVNGTVYGLSRRGIARSNMSANLGALAGWSAWARSAAVIDRTPGTGPPRP